METGSIRKRFRARGPGMTAIWGIEFSVEVSKQLVKMAEKRNILPHDLVPELVIEALNHQRFCNKTQPQIILRRGKSGKRSRIVSDAPAGALGPDLHG